MEEIVAQRDPEEYSLSMEVENEEVNIGIQSRVNYACSILFFILS